MTLNASIIDMEHHYIVHCVKELALAGPNRTILDVGCGFGRNLKALSSIGLTATGVDVNREAVSSNQALGLSCYLPDENDWKREYDIILMSHIIEHFSYQELITFIEEYLSYLKIGGRLVIATPLLTDYFYNDYTHVKPYPPEAIIMAFGSEARQVSTRSSLALIHERIWFRTSPYKIRWVGSRYFGGVSGSLIKLLNGALVLLYIIGFGFFGKKDGWVGTFKREK